MYDPTLYQDELNRKVIDTSLNLLKKLEAHEISNSSFAIGMQAVWSATAGLVKDQVQDAIDTTLNEGLKCRCEMVFTKERGNSISIFSKDVSDSEVEISMVIVTTSPTTNYKKKIYTVPKDKFEALINSIIADVTSKGFSLAVGAKL